MYPSPVNTGFQLYPEGTAVDWREGCVPLHGGIVLDMHNMDKILDIDTDNLYAVVEPGVIHANLNARLGELNFFFAADPASTDFCTIGGMIGTNASGMTCLKYGDTRKSVLGLDVVLPDGTVINTGASNSRSGGTAPGLTPGGGYICDWLRPNGWQ